MVPVMLRKSQSNQVHTNTQAHSQDMHVLTVTWLTSANLQSKVLQGASSTLSSAWLLEQMHHPDSRS